MKRLGGWWRLWIFTCGLWLAFVAVLGFEGWPRHRPRLTAEDMAKLSPGSQALLFVPQGKDLSQELFGMRRREDLGQSALPDDLFSKPQKATGWDALAEAATPSRGVNPWKNSPVVFQSPEGAEHLLVPSTTLAQLESFKADYARIQNIKFREERTGFLGRVLLIWASPCLFSLLLGLSIRWVFRGFRHEFTMNEKSS